MRPRGVLPVVSAAVFLANLDLFVVNVALPVMNEDYDTTLAALSWVLNAYAIVFAALLVVAGRLADRYGHRQVFLLGLAVFTAASAACALAPGVGTLVAARAVQAAGAAMLMPTSLALLLAATPAEGRPRAIRLWASVGGIAAGLGPVAGGLLVEADWRWVFLINLPFGLAAFAAGLRALPALPRAEAGPFPDLAGAALLTLGIGALAVGLVRAEEGGWTGPETLGGLAAGAAATAAFLWRSARHPAPVVELPLLRVRAFAAANTGALLFTVAFAGMLLTAVLWCQDVWGYSALATGLAVAPGPLIVPPVTLATGALTRRLGAAPVLWLGSAAFGAGLLWWLATAGERPSYAAELLPGMLLTGLGVGLALPTLIGASAASLPPERFATGSAITTMNRQIGAVLGVALAVSILGTPATAEAAVDGFRGVWLLGLAAMALLAAAAVPLRVRPSPAG
ncbi:MFS transporter [Streptomyces sp. DSM 44917]|uniref:MFS transporter n=1 Tax=Streptomyces boetiae TaxID=3075541 RepID=A0ABU2LHN6_9ACTN|nr:MFS transporter [Streptomyces sp. DSM 44917]MDT0310658.1 MFS transporter [Streptomyces sp. DSM 44917]